MPLAEILALVERILNLKLFVINNTPITLVSVVTFAIVLLAFVVLSRVFSKMFVTKVLAHLQVEESTRYNFLRITQYTLTIIGAIVAFQFIGIDLSGLAVIFGLLSVGIGFGDSAWNMRLRLWIADPKRHTVVRSDINCAIIEKFRARGIEMPFPQQVLHLRIAKT